LRPEIPDLRDAAVFQAAQDDHMTVPALSSTAPISEPAALDISGWIAHWAQWTPGQTALRFEGRCVTYAELASAVRRAAAWLAASGVSRGDRVAYLGPNCPELLELLFACASMGAIFVPLNTRMPAAELRVFLAATRPRLVVAENGVRDVALASAGEDRPDRVVTSADAARREGFADDAERVRAEPGPDLAALTGSTFVPRRAVEPWQQRGVPVMQGYGSTETCPVVTSLPAGSPGEKALTAGKPVLYHRVRIVDTAGADVAAGEPGEIWIRGRSVMLGYWENPQATREAFRDGWFRNGDLGLFDEQGYLHILDRIKDIIIVGSSNVYPSDLETVLGDCADISEAAVVGRRDDRLGEVPVACVVTVPGRSLTREQVIALFDGRLATYKHPRDVIFLDGLPRNAPARCRKRSCATS
jgi:acyl-CoA synthetase (AMP-forming)/AMP-acid ligase II